MQVQSRKSKVKSQQIQASRLKTYPLSPTTHGSRLTTASDDEYWMRLALSLALKGQFGTSPNPVVGACVVLKGKLVGQGWHKEFGGPHAEVIALRQAGKRAKGAVLYVTLEPCSTWGKTPPCVDAVIQAGLREVVFAVRDPNPKHAGQAVSILKKAGIRVRSGVLTREAERQNEPFLKWIQTGRPFVSLKMAQTLDGKIATRSGHSRWISSPESRELVQELRRSHDAVFVGKNTLFKDDPGLNVKAKKTGLSRGGVSFKPWKVVLDPCAEVSRKAKIFSGSQAIFLVVGEKFLRKASQVSWPSPVTLLPLKEAKNGRLHLGQLLDKLGDLGASSLLIEGGGEVAWSFLSEGLVDRIIWIMAPKFFGGQSAKTSVEGLGVSETHQALSLKTWTVFPCGVDLVLEGRF